MILYSLACDAGHRFDSWFSSSAAYDALAAATRLACPTCGSAHVAKSVMAPAVVGGRGRRAGSEEETSPPAAAADATPTPAGDVALLDPKHAELRALVKAFHAKVVAEAQDVGRAFPTEARRIHEGEAPNRQIRGQATAQEARDLIEDGVMVLPVPTLPDDQN